MFATLAPLMTQPFESSSEPSTGFSADSTSDGEPGAPNVRQNAQSTNNISPAIKVAIDTGPLYGHRSGVGVATAGMVDALAIRTDVDLHPYLISFRADPNAGHRRLPLPGIVASHVWSRMNRPLADRWLADVDVVHGTNYFVPPTRRPTVVTVYDTWFLDNPELASPTVRRASRNLRRTVERGATVHTTSQATATNVRRIFQTDRVRVVHLGPPAQGVAATDDDRARLVRDLDLRAEIGDTRLVIAIGTEEHRKDFPLLVDAFGRLDQTLNPVLVIAGAAGDASDAIADAIAALPSERRQSIRRLGPIDATTKSALLTVADVLAYPSLDEGFGFPILEAQQMGVPVVARAVGSIPETGGDGVALFRDRDADQLATLLTAVLTEPAMRDHLIAAGHTNVGRFSWSATAAELCDIYGFAMEER